MDKQKRKQFFKQVKKLEYVGILDTGGDLGDEIICDFDKDIRLVYNIREIFTNGELDRIYKVSYAETPSHHCVRPQELSDILRKPVRSYRKGFPDREVLEIKEEFSPRETIEEFFPKEFSSQIKCHKSLS